MAKRTRFQAGRSTQPQVNTATAKMGTVAIEQPRPTPASLKDAATPQLGYLSSSGYVDVSRDGKRIDPESEEGKAIQAIYSRQFEETIDNAAQLERFLAVTRGQASIEDTLLNPGTTNRYEGSNIKPNREQLIRTYFEERGVPLTEQFSNVNLRPVKYTAARERARLATNTGIEMGDLRDLLPGTSAYLKSGESIPADRIRTGEIYARRDNFLRQAGEIKDVVDGEVGTVARDPSYNQVVSTGLIPGTPGMLSGLSVAQGADRTLQNAALFIAGGVAPVTGLLAGIGGVFKPKAKGGAIPEKVPDPLYRPSATEEGREQVEEEISDDVARDWTMDPIIEGGPDDYRVIDGSILQRAVEKDGAFGFLVGTGEVFKRLGKSLVVPEEQLGQLGYYAATQTPIEEWRIKESALDLAINPILEPMAPYLAPYADIDASWDDVGGSLARFGGASATTASNIGIGMATPELRDAYFAEAGRVGGESWEKFQKYPLYYTGTALGEIPLALVGAGQVGFLARAGVKITKAALVADAGMKGSRVTAKANVLAGQLKNVDSTIESLSKKHNFNEKDFNSLIKDRNSILKDIIDFEHVDVNRTMKATEVDNMFKNADGAYKEGVSSNTIDRVNQLKAVDRKLNDQFTVPNELKNAIKTREDILDRTMKLVDSTDPSLRNDPIAIQNAVLKKKKLIEDTAEEKANTLYQKLVTQPGVNYGAWKKRQALRLGNLITLGGKSTLGGRLDPKMFATPRSQYRAALSQERKQGFGLARFEPRTWISGLAFVPRLTRAFAEVGSPSSPEELAAYPNPLNLFGKSQLEADVGRMGAGTVPVEYTPMMNAWGGMLRGLGVQNVQIKARLIQDKVQAMIKSPKTIDTETTKIEFDVTNQIVFQPGRIGPASTQKPDTTISMTMPADQPIGFQKSFGIGVAGIDQPMQITSDVTLGQYRSPGFTFTSTEDLLTQYPSFEAISNFYKQTPPSSPFGALPKGLSKTEPTDIIGAPFRVEGSFTAGRKMTTDEVIDLGEELPIVATPTSQVTRNYEKNLNKIQEKIAKLDSDEIKVWGDVSKINVLTSGISWSSVKNDIGLNKFFADVTPNVKTNLNTIEKGKVTDYQTRITQLKNVIETNEKNNMDTTSLRRELKDLYIEVDKIQYDNPYPTYDNYIDSIGRQTESLMPGMGEIGERAINEIKDFAGKGKLKKAFGELRNTEELIRKERGAIKKINPADEKKLRRSQDKLLLLERKATAQRENLAREMKDNAGFLGAEVQFAAISDDKIFTKNPLTDPTVLLTKPQAQKLHEIATKRIALEGEKEKIVMDFSPQKVAFTFTRDVPFDAMSASLTDIVVTKSGKGRYIIDAKAGSDGVIPTLKGEFLDFMEQAGGMTPGQKKKNAKELQKAALGNKEIADTGNTLFRFITPNRYDNTAKHDKVTHGVIDTDNRILGDSNLQKQYGLEPRAIKVGDRSPTKEEVTTGVYTKKTKVPIWAYATDGNGNVIFDVVQPYTAADEVDYLKFITGKGFDDKANLSEFGEQTKTITKDRVANITPSGEKVIEKFEYNVSTFANQFKMTPPKSQDAYAQNIEVLEKGLETTMGKVGIVDDRLKTVQKGISDYEKAYAIAKDIMKNDTIDIEYELNRLADPTAMASVTSRNIKAKEQNISDIKDQIREVEDQINAKYVEIGESHVTMSTAIKPVATKKFLLFNNDYPISGMGQWDYMDSDIFTRVAQNTPTNPIDNPEKIFNQRQYFELIIDALESPEASTKRLNKLWKDVDVKADTDVEKLNLVKEVSMKYLDDVKGEDKMKEIRKEIKEIESEKGRTYTEKIRAVKQYVLESAKDDRDQLKAKLDEAFSFAGATPDQKIQIFNARAKTILDQTLGTVKTTKNEKGEIDIVTDDFMDAFVKNNNLIADAEELMSTRKILKQNLVNEQQDLTEIKFDHRTLQKLATQIKRDGVGRHPLDPIIAPIELDTLPKLFGKYVNISSDRVEWIRGTGKGKIAVTEEIQELFPGGNVPDEITAPVQFGMGGGGDDIMENLSRGSMPYTGKGRPPVGKKLVLAGTVMVDIQLGTVTVQRKLPIYALPGTNQYLAKGKDLRFTMPETQNLTTMKPDQVLVVETGLKEGLKAKKTKKDPETGEKKYTPQQAALELFNASQGRSEGFTGSRTAGQNVYLLPTATGVRQGPEIDIDMYVRNLTDQMDQNPNREFLLTDGGVINASNFINHFGDFVFEKNVIIPRSFFEKLNPQQQAKYAATHTKDVLYTGLKTVRSGGQRGVDQVGVETAKDAGLKTGGVMPAGWRVEGGNAEAWGRKYGFTQSSDSSFTTRTDLNVQQSDATVYYGAVDANGNPSSPGGIRTADAASRYAKPFIVNPDPETLAEFLARNNVQELNVAGTRASKQSTSLIGGKTPNEYAKESLGGAIKLTKPAVMGEADVPDRFTAYLPMEVARQVQGDIVRVNSDVFKDDIIRSQAVVPALAMKASSQYMQSVRQISNNLKKQMEDLGTKKDKINKEIEVNDFNDQQVRAIVHLVNQYQTGSKTIKAMPGVKERYKGMYDALENFKNKEFYKQIENIAKGKDYNLKKFFTPKSEVPISEIRTNIDFLKDLLLKAKETKGLQGKIVKKHTVNPTENSGVIVAREILPNLRDKAKIYEVGLGGGVLELGAKWRRNEWFEKNAESSYAIVSKETVDQTIASLEVAKNKAGSTGAMDELQKKIDELTGMSKQLGGEQKYGDKSIIADNYNALTSDVSIVVLPQKNVRTDGSSVHFDYNTFIKKLETYEAQDSMLESLKKDLALLEKENKTLAPTSSKYLNNQGKIILLQDKIESETEILVRYAGQVRNSDPTGVHGTGQYNKNLHREWNEELGKYVDTKYKGWVTNKDGNNQTRHTIEYMLKDKERRDKLFVLTPDTDHAELEAFLKMNNPKRINIVGVAGPIQRTKGGEPIGPVNTRQAEQHFQTNQLINKHIFGEAIKVGTDSKGKPIYEQVDSGTEVIAHLKNVEKLEDVKLTLGEKQVGEKGTLEFISKLRSAITANERVLQKAENQITSDLNIISGSTHTNISKANRKKVETYSKQPDVKDDNMFETVEKLYGVNVDRRTNNVTTDILAEIKKKINSETPSVSTFSSTQLRNYDRLKRQYNQAVLAIAMNRNIIDNETVSTMKIATDNEKTFSTMLREIESINPDTSDINVEFGKYVDIDNPDEIKRLATNAGIDPKNLNQKINAWLREYTGSNIGGLFKEKTKKVIEKESMEAEAVFAKGEGAQVAKLVDQQLDYGLTENQLDFVRNMVGKTDFEADAYMNPNVITKNVEEITDVEWNNLQFLASKNLVKFNNKGTTAEYQDSYRMRAYLNPTKPTGKQTQPMYVDPLNPQATLSAKEVEERYGVKQTRDIAEFLTRTKIVEEQFDGSYVVNQAKVKGIGKFLGDTETIREKYKTSISKQRPTMDKDDTDLEVIQAIISGDKQRGIAKLDKDITAIDREIAEQMRLLDADKADINAGQVARAEGKVNELFELHAEALARGDKGVADKIKKEVSSTFGDAFGGTNIWNQWQSKQLTSSVKAVIALDYREKIVQPSRSVLEYIIQGGKMSDLKDTNVLKGLKDPKGNPLITGLDEIIRTGTDKRLLKKWEKAHEDKKLSEVEWAKQEHEKMSVLDDTFGDYANASITNGTLTLETRILPRSNVERKLKNLKIEIEKIKENDIKNHTRINKTVSDTLEKKQNEYNRLKTGREEWERIIDGQYNERAVYDVEYTKPDPEFDDGSPYVRDAEMTFDTDDVTRNEYFISQVYGKRIKNIDMGGTDRDTLRRFFGDSVRSFKGKVYEELTPWDESFMRDILTQVKKEKTKKVKDLSNDIGRYTTPPQSQKTKQAKLSIINSMSDVDRLKDSFEVMQKKSGTIPVSDINVGSKIEQVFVLNPSKRDSTSAIVIEEFANKQRFWRSEDADVVKKGQPKKGKKDPKLKQRVGKKDDVDPFEEAENKLIDDRRVKVYGSTLRPEGTERALSSEAKEIMGDKLKNVRLEMTAKEEQTRGLTKMLKDMEDQVKRDRKQALKETGSGTRGRFADIIKDADVEGHDKSNTRSAMIVITKKDGTDAKYTKDGRVILGDGKTGDSKSPLLRLISRYSKDAKDKEVLLDKDSDGMPIQLTNKFGDPVMVRPEKTDTKPRVIVISDPSDPAQIMEVKRLLHEQNVRYLGVVGDNLDDYSIRKQVSKNMRKTELDQGVFLPDPVYSVKGMMGQLFGTNIDSSKLGMSSVRDGLIDMVETNKNKEILPQKLKQVEDKIRAAELKKESRDKEWIPRTENLLFEGFENSFKDKYSGINRNKLLGTERVLELIKKRLIKDEGKQREKVNKEVTKQQIDFVRQNDPTTISNFVRSEQEVLIAGNKANDILSAAMKGDTSQNDVNKFLWSPTGDPGTPGTSIVKVNTYLKFVPTLDTPKPEVGIMSRIQRRVLGTQEKQKAKRDETFYSALDDMTAQDPNTGEFTSLGTLRSSTSETWDTSEGLKASLTKEYLISLHNTNNPKDQVKSWNQLIMKTRGSDYNRILGWVVDGYTLKSEKLPSSIVGTTKTRPTSLSGDEVFFKLLNKEAIGPESQTKSIEKASNVFQPAVSDLSMTDWWKGPTKGDKVVYNILKRGGHRIKSRLPLYANKKNVGGWVGQLNRPLIPEKVQRRLDLFSFIERGKPKQTVEPDPQRPMEQAKLTGQYPVERESLFEGQVQAVGSIVSTPKGQKLQAPMIREELFTKEYADAPELAKDVEAIFKAERKQNVPDWFVTTSNTDEATLNSWIRERDTTKRLYDLTRQDIDEKVKEKEKITRAASGLIGKSDDILSKEDLQKLNQAETQLGKIATEINNLKSTNKTHLSQIDELTKKIKLSVQPIPGVPGATVTDEFGFASRVRNVFGSITSPSTPRLPTWAGKKSVSEPFEVVVDYDVPAQQIPGRQEVTKETRQVIRKYLGTGSDFNIEIEQVGTTFAPKGKKVAFGSGEFPFQITDAGGVKSIVDAVKGATGTTESFTKRETFTPKTGGGAYGYDTSGGFIGDTAQQTTQKQKTKTTAETKQDQTMTEAMEKSTKAKAPDTKDIQRSIGMGVYGMEYSQYVNQFLSGPPTAEAQEQKPVQRIDTTLPTIRMNLDRAITKNVKQPAVRISNMMQGVVAGVNFNTAKKLSQASAMITATTQSYFPTQAMASQTDLENLRYTEQLQTRLKIKPTFKQSPDMRLALEPRGLQLPKPKPAVIPRTIPIQPALMFPLPPFDGGAPKRQRPKPKKSKKKKIGWQVPDVWFGYYSPDEYTVFGGQEPKKLKKQNKRLD